MIELIIMSLLVTLSVEVSPVKSEPNIETGQLNIITGEAIKFAGAQDKRVLV